jgi:PAS domain S-box-containing protein
LLEHQLTWERAEAIATERASRERLELALRAANMGTWEWDLRSNCVAWSPELEAIHGFPPGSFGTSLDVYLGHLHPEDAERVRTQIAASLQTGELHLEYRGIRPDGEERWYEARGQVTWAPGGDPVALRGVCMDINARKLAEQSLRDSEERFRTLADNISPFAWMADASGWIFWYNRRWYDYTGTSPEDMQGWGWTKVHHPDHVDRVVRRIKRSWETGEPWEDTFPLRGRDGHYRWFLSRALPTRDESGRIVRWLGTNTDITERRWTEALIAGERNALELIARGSPTGVVLEELCRTVEGLADDGLLASILLLDENGVHLRHGAAPGLPDDYNQAIDGTQIGPSAGSCGTAAFRGEQVIVSDIAVDPLWTPYRDLALRHGLRACWSTPIRGHDGSILGTFALYYHQPRTPAADHLRLATLVGRTAATVIERKRADDTRARLQAERDRLFSAERTSRELAEASGRRLAVQYRLAELLAADQSESTPHVLPALCRGLGWDWAALWRVDAEAGVLRCAEFCQADPGALDAFEEASRVLCFAPGEGLLGRVWAAGEPIWSVDLPHEPEFTRAAAAKQAGLRSGVILPLRVRGEIVGVLSFYSCDERPPDANMLATLIGIGDQLGQFLHRRQVEETVRRQSALLELAPVAVTVRDAQRHITYWNPAAETLYGWTADLALGQISHDLLQTHFPDGLEAHEAALESEGTWEGELVRRRRDGQEVIISSRWLVLRNDEGDHQTLEVSTDITEHKQAEAARARLYESEKDARAAAEAAIKARDEFVAVVSHDLRNPLAAVKGQIQIVRRRAARGQMPTAEQLIERLDVVQSSIAALSAQIDELHDATQLQAGRPLELRKAPTDLVGLARDCVIRHQHASESHQLRFESAVAELVGVWDAGRLERVIANMLSNAIKYSPAGGEILLLVRAEPEWAVLSVSDHGLGIPAADLPYVFERFRRASNVGRVIAGSGLGLAGARDIVEQHGGTIGVTSEEGRGSTFVVRLSEPGRNDRWQRRTVRFVCRNVL